MKKFLFVFAALAVAGCAVWDYGKAQQNCIDSYVGNPAAREQCICDVAHDAGRSCDFLGLDGGAE